MTNIHTRLHLRLVRGVLCLLLIAGCGGENDTNGGELSDPSVQPATDENNGETNETGTGNGSRQLVLWAPEFFNPDKDTSAGALLEGAFFQFEQNHPGLTIDVQIKAEHGQAGLLSYLRAAQRVAPAIMPDLVLLHSSQLWQIAELGMVPPLEAEERLLDESFYPFTLEAVHYREESYGTPYIANILHGAATQPENGALPTTWDDLPASESPYLFPAGGIEGLRLPSAVMHYRAAGGVLDEEGAAAASTDALETLFEFLILARENGNIPDLVLEHSTYESLWDAIDPEEELLTLVSAQDFLHDPKQNMLYVPAPTASGQPTTIGNTWAFAVLARDENQRDLSLELVWYLLAPEIQGPWSQAAHRLPSQPEALARWSEMQGGYIAFLEDQIEATEAIPTGRTFADFSRRLHGVQAGLLRGELTVEEAIQEARTIE